MRSSPRLVRQPARELRPARASRSLRRSSRKRARRRARPPCPGPRTSRKGRRRRRHNRRWPRPAAAAKRASPTAIWRVRPPPGLHNRRRAMVALGDEYKVSVNDVLLKAVATALAQHPEVNSHWLGDRIRMFNRVHLGVAVATDDGLIVPVVFDADRKSMRQISAEVKELARLARERRLKPDQYTGSTFSVSNLGMYGIDQFTAIINPPEPGTLAVGRAQDKPLLVDGALSTRQRLRLTMSCAHRAAAGAVATRGLQALDRLIET